MKRYIVFLIGMVVLFTSQIHAASLMSEREFQDYVYTYLQKNYKDRKFVKGVDPSLITNGTTELGLSNLYNKYKQAVAAGEVLDAMLKEHFTTLFRKIEKTDENDVKQWSVVKELVRPQIAPKEFQNRLPITHKGLDDYSSVAYVIDGENGYQYVTQDMFASWGITMDTLHATAVANLDKVSHKIPMQGTLEKNKFLIIAVGDGYDAARLLIPALRKFISSKLGTPYYAAIPNRDFLIMWSTSNSKDFTRSFTDKVEADFKSQPYPLTPNIFLVSDSDVRVTKKP